MLHRLKMTYRAIWIAYRADMRSTWLVYKAEMRTAWRDEMARK